ncbi:MAG: hypothetical protein ACJ74T_09400, partial [Pyrinomonadaceae bacterium]
MPRRITRALVALSLLLNAAPVAMSQTVYARLVVITLKRPLGGGAPQPLAGATVTLTNERGAQRECK